MSTTPPATPDKNTPEAFIENASPARKLLVGMMVLLGGAVAIFGASILIALFVGFLGNMQARRDAERGVKPGAQQVRPVPGLPGTEPGMKQGKPDAPGQGDKAGKAGKADGADQVDKKP